MDECFIGCDLGGTKILAVAYSPDWRPLGRCRTKTKGHEGIEAGLARVQHTIQAALDEAGLRRDQIAGIGMACPGPLDLERGVVLETPNLGWTDVPMKESLERAFDAPVVLVNDVDAGVYGEYRCGAAHAARCVVGLFPGTGIGGGCVYEGRILRGRKRSCMEIGHMQVVPDGPRCGCGRRGCLEAVASRLAISAAAASAAYRGEAPHLRELAGTSLADIRSGVLAKAIKAGDSVVEHLVRDAACHIGTALGSVVNLLLPEVIVLGGGLIEALGKIMLPVIEQAARARAMPTFADAFRVVEASLGDDATVLGAAAWAEEMVTLAARS
jgi:glucokinase